jgi:hypothetical protein
MKRKQVKQINKINTGEIRKLKKDMVLLACQALGIEIKNEHDLSDEAIDNLHDQVFQKIQLLTFTPSYTVQSRDRYFKIVGYMMQYVDELYKKNNTPIIMHEKTKILIFCLFIFGNQVLKNLTDKQDARQYLERLIEHYNNLSTKCLVYSQDEKVVPFDDNRYTQVSLVGELATYYCNHISSVEVDAVHQHLKKMNVLRKLCNNEHQSYLSSSYYVLKIKLAQQNQDYIAMKNYFKKLIEISEAPAQVMSIYLGEGFIASLKSIAKTLFIQGDYDNAVEFAELIKEYTETKLYNYVIEKKLYSAMPDMYLYLKERVGLDERDQKQKYKHALDAAEDAKKCYITTVKCVRMKKLDAMKKIGLQYEKYVQGVDLVTTGEHVETKIVLIDDKAARYLYRELKNVGFLVGQDNNCIILNDILNLNVNKVDVALMKLVQQIELMDTRMLSSKSSQQVIMQSLKGEEQENNQRCDEKGKEKEKEPSRVERKDEMTYEKKKKRKKGKGKEKEKGKEKQKPTKREEKTDGLSRPSDNNTIKAIRWGNGYPTFNPYNANCHVYKLYGSTAHNCYVYLNKALLDYLNDFNKEAATNAQSICARGRTSIRKQGDKGVIIHGDNAKLKDPGVDYRLFGRKVKSVTVGKKTHNLFEINGFSPRHKDTPTYF